MSEENLQQRAKLAQRVVNNLNDQTIEAVGIRNRYILELREAGYRITDIAEFLGVSRNLIYKVINKK